MARRGRRVRSGMCGRFCGTILRTGYADVATFPGPGRRGPQGRTVVRVCAATLRRRDCAATAAMRVRGHRHARPDRLFEGTGGGCGGSSGRERGLVGRVLWSHRVETSARRARVLLLPTGVRVLRAVVLLGGRATRLPRAHQWHDGRRVPERRPAGRHRGQSRVPGGAQAHADPGLGRRHGRCPVHCRRLSVRVP